MLNDIGIILLAAGSSNRLGESKQLLPYKGKSLLKHAIQAAELTEPAQLVVVLGANADEHFKEISDTAVSITYNQNWERGIGSSISCGIQHLLHLMPETEAAIILLCDQPYLEAQVIENLIQKHKSTSKGIIACTYEETIGTPALFHKTYFSELKLLEGKQGAKALFKQYENDLATVEFPEGAIDIDTQEDYLNLIKTNT